MKNEMNSKETRKVIKAMSTRKVRGAQRKVESEFYITTLQDYRLKLMLELIPNILEINTDLEGNFGLLIEFTNAAFRKVIPLSVTKADVKNNYKQISSTEYSAYNECINKKELQDKVNNADEYSKWDLEKLQEALIG